MTIPNKDNLILRLPEEAHYGRGAVVGAGGSIIKGK